jgi:para-nitrobenzyl esterase
MVFVHGGAFVTGAGSEPQYDGRELAAKGVVVVSLNYRLGALGFLAAAPGVPPNLGLHDQVCALRWVRAHIAHFGGRPGQVTAFGESAGAMSLGCLLGTELRRRENLFQACALMSGAAHLTLSQDQATLVRDAWFAALNLGSPDREALLALPVQALVAAAGKVALGKVAQQLKGKLMPWQPCVLENAERGTDALFEGVPPFVRIARGVASDVRVMAGVVDSEYTLFMLDGGWKRGVYKSGGDLPSSGEFRQGLADRLAKWCTGDVRFREVPDLAAKCARVAAFYVRGDGELTPDALEAAFERLHSVWLFDLPGDRLLRAHALTAGPRASFAYRVTLRSEVEALRSPHAMDLPLVFGTLDGPFGQLLVGGSPDARRVSRDMMRAFVRFAKNGDPGFAPFVAGHVQMFGPPPAGPPLGGATLFQSEQEREVWEWASHHVQLMPGVVGAGGGGGGKAAAKL